MDPAALREQLRRLHADSFGWAMCCAGERALAEEALQIAYLKVLDGKAIFSGRSTFKTWLFAVVRQTAADRRRWSWLRRKREASPPSAAANAAANAVDDRPAPDEMLQRRETVQRLQHAVKTLSARQRQVLQLTFYDGLTIADAAMVMGVSVGSARTHYERAKQALRDRLQSDGPDHERETFASVAASDAGV